MRKHKFLIIFLLLTGIILALFLFSFRQLEVNKTGEAKRGDVLPGSTQGSKDVSSDKSDIQKNGDPGGNFDLKIMLASPMPQEKQAEVKKSLPNIGGLTFSGNISKSAFIAKQNKIFDNIGPLQFERITTIQVGSSILGSVSYKYWLNGLNGKTILPDLSTIITGKDGCFRTFANSDQVIKYTVGGPEDNCRMHANWSKYTADQFTAMPDFKVLGETVWQGMKVTGVEFPDTIAGSQYILTVLVSNDTDLTVVVNGTSGDKLVAVEFKNYDRTSFDNSIFAVDSAKVKESSEIF